MFQKRLLVVISLVLAGSHLMAQSVLSVGVKKGQLASAISRLDGLGKLVETDAKYSIFRLLPNPNSKALVALVRKDKSVVFVREGTALARFDDRDLNSLSNTNQILAEMKGRNSDRERMAKVLGLPPLEKMEKIKTGYYEAYRYWLEERAYPNNKVNYRAYEEGVLHREQMPPAYGRFGDSLGSMAWQYVGPTNLDIPYSTYYGVRPINGRVNALAVDPTSPNTLYLGGGWGGVWKSTNSGVNWTALTDGWEWLTVSNIAVHPTNGNIIYIGTGDFAGGIGYQFGIMKSLDGGATWTNLGRAEFGTRAVSSIAIDPENPNIVTVSTGRGSGGSGFVWRSINGGTNWTNVLNAAQNWSQISIGALNTSNGSRAYYASAGGTGGNVWRSLDRGASWSKLTTLASAGTNHSVISVCASPVFPDTVYMVVNADRQVHKSTDRGATWTNITGTFPNGSNNYFWSQSTYNWYLNVSTRPGPQDVIYVGMIDAAQSYDGGATWRSIGGPTYAGSALTHNDQHFCAIDPTNPNKVYIGGDGGAYRYTFDPSTNNGTWGYLNRYLGVSMFYKADFHNSNSNVMIGGTQDNATPASIGDLANWENCGGGDGGFSCINQTSPNIQYTTSQNLGVYRTSNYWSSQTTITPSTGTDSKAFIAPIILDPNNYNLLYVGTNYLWRRDDTTGVWTPRLGNQLLSATGNLRAIAIAPGDTNRIYTGASDGQVWMSTDKGATWTQINTGLTSLPSRTITYISVNPANKDEIIVTVSGTGSGHVWKCVNTTAGIARTWTDKSGSGITGIPNVPANSICMDMFDFDSTWFVGTDLGVFMTENGGATWTSATRPLGLPNVRVNDVKIATGLQTLYAATYGRGMWKFDMPKTFWPSNMTVISGTLFSGDMANLLSSDNSYVQIFNDDIDANGEIEFTFAATAGPVLELGVAFETAASRPNLTQNLRLFDHISGTWVAVDSRTATTLDTRVVINVSNPSRFVSAFGQIKARLLWVPISDTSTFDGWTEKIDRFAIRIVR
jgi:hypothetical protein